MSYPIKHAVLSLPLLVALAACGGGGGGDGSGSGGGGGGGDVNAASTKFCDENFSVEEVMAKINAMRSVGRNCGSTFFPAAPPLNWNSKLAEAAYRHSLDMATNNFVSHTGSDGSSYQSRAKDAGYVGTVAENVGGGQRTMDEAIDWWLKSPGHCVSIMNAAHKGYGIACVAKKPSTYTFHWTQLFGRNP